jgi:hypothetical protein
MASYIHGSMIMADGSWWEYGPILVRSLHLIILQLGYKLNYKTSLSHSIVLSFLSHRDNCNREWVQKLHFLFHASQPEYVINYH